MVVVFQYIDEDVFISIFWFLSYCLGGFFHFPFEGTPKLNYLIRVGFFSHNIPYFFSHVEAPIFIFRFSILTQKLDIIPSRFKPSLKKPFHRFQIETKK